MFSTLYICVLICDIDCVLLVCTLQIFHFPAQLVVFVGAGLHPVVIQQNCRVSDRTRHLMNPYSMLHVFVFLVIVISSFFKQEYSRCNLKTPFKTGVLTKTEAYKVLNKRKMLRMFSKVRKQKCLYVRFRGGRLTSSPECPCTLSSSCDSPERKSKTDGEQDREELKMFHDIWCWSCSRTQRPGWFSFKHVSARVTLTVISSIYSRTLFLIFLRIFFSAFSSALVSGSLVGTG